MFNRKAISHIHKAWLILIPIFMYSMLFAQDVMPPGDKLPPTVFDRIEMAGEAADFDDADYIVVLDKAVNRMKESGVTYVDTYVLYKILTDKGSKNRAVMTWGFDPQSSYIDVREVNIIRDGEAIPVDVSAVKELPAPQSAIYWSDRIKTLQLPRLKVNDGIEIITFKKGYTYALLDEPEDDRYVPPMPGEYFDIVRFEGSVPIIEKKYVLSVPKGKLLQSEVYNGSLYSSTSYTADSTFYAWWTFDVPPRPHEPRQPGDTDYVTKVVMSTAESWEAKSKWFYDMNDVKNQQFVYTDEIAAKVKEILEEAGVVNKSEADKAEALNHWVAQNIRYSGQTMGEGEGFTLHSGEMIYEQRSGVCKDIAGMLITMMRAANMDSYPAMTMAGSRIESIPADQFNHCVVALKKEDGSFVMYDPTWIPYNNDIWSKLETEQHFVVGTPEGETLSSIAYSPPEESFLKVNHKAEILEDGTLKGTFTLNGKGALDSRLRRLVTRNGKANFESSFSDMLHPVGDRVQDVKYEYHPNDDFSNDMWIKLSYTIPEFAFPIDGGYEFKSPMMQVTTNHVYLFRGASTKWEEERETDVFLYYTQLVDGTETIKLPKGYKAIETTETDEVDETYAYFKGSSETTKKGLVIRQKAEVRRRQIPPDGYPGFYDAMKGVQDWADQVYRIEKGGAK
ncbi:MAG: DUF3857 and transglutaminase domain-containing protein [Candidatus Electryonea clarkiae]|nr:DUF3857 and transglutaminase domain-containing protein [Candidatus Electryonea clarkiae]MDP8285368.1 DUF3857 and transglutaminase domain-containing protein [Candidatus Electryonea clarkiae]